MSNRKEVKELEISGAQKLLLESILWRWVSKNKWDKDKAKQVRNILRQIEDF
jgi:hypothetical protein